MLQNVDRLFEETGVFIPYIFIGNGFMILLLELTMTLYNKFSGVEIFRVGYRVLLRSERIFLLRSFNPNNSGIGGKPPTLVQNNFTVHH